MESFSTQEQALLLESELTKIVLQNGILIISWKCSYLDIGICRKIVKSRHSVVKGVHPALLIIKSLNDSTKEAREFLASEAACEGLSAVAVFVENVAENMMATLFLQLNKPRIPVKIFNDKEKAKQWLMQYV